MSSNLQVTSSNSRVTSSNPEVRSSNSRVTSSSPQTPESMTPMKTQVNSLQILTRNLKIRSDIINFASQGNFK